MTATNQLAEKKNIISGKVLLKESGKGIPDLTVMIYQNVTVTSPDAAPTRASSKKSEESIGSALTDSSGNWSISFEDSDLKSKSGSDKRPDLTIAVIAPEDADSTTPPVVLLKSELARKGRKESHCAYISSKKLTDAGIRLPGEEKESPQSKIQTYISQKKDEADIETGIAAFHKSVAENHTEEEEDFRKKFKKTFSSTPDELPGNGLFVGEDENISEKVTENFHSGLDNINDELSRNKKGVPVNLYFTPEDRQRLANYFDNPVNGFVEIPESEIRPILFRSGSSENVGTLLVNSNPILKYCKEKTSDEICAKEHLENNHHEHDTGNGNITGPNITTVAGSDIPTYIARLINNMPSPDSVLNPDAMPSRPSQESIADSINKFGLKKGPAEVAAYYDFNSLQIAFKHVWQQLFDEEMINAGHRLHKKVLSKTGVDSIKSDKFSLERIMAAVRSLSDNAITHVPVKVAAHFDITKEEWNDLRHGLQEKLKTIANTLDDSLEIKTVPVTFFGFTTNTAVIDALTKEKYYQKLKEQGERIIESVRHDDYYTMHKTLRDLHNRLNSKYEYTVFAANRDHCSVNFGILNTYRQEWLPLNYQVGKLCKAIPLSPKEEKKYSMKIAKHVKRSEKDSRKNNTTFTGEQSSTSRTEGEIVEKAQNKTNFNLTTQGTYNIGISKGSTNTSLGVEALNESQQSRKDFREAIIKATQEYKDERSTEVDTEESTDSEYNDSGTIVNPNDELSVTYLFYELQRRYRISEQLYRVMPVVLVAQPVPKPHHITEAWVIANDWILNRFLLDDSFTPALNYLANKSVGDDFALRELRKNLRQQRNLVETLKIEFGAASREAENKYQALLSKVKERIDIQEEENGEGFFTNVGAFFGHNDADPETAKARELAAADEHRYAVEKAEKLSASLTQQVDALHKLTAEYNKTLQTHLDNETRTKRLLVHFRNNILYYMQAIWSMEPPDQRFLRLQKVKVPNLKLDETADGGGRTYKVRVEASEDIFAAFRPAGTEKHKAFLSGTLKKPIHFKPLIEVADLDRPLGFKGNYMIFPMKAHNALTEFMAAPYIDSAFGAMDPDELSNVSLNDFSTYVCCLHDNDPAKFEELKPTLNKWLAQLLADPLRNGDEIIIPSGSLYIEALPGAQPLLEDFKLKHRTLDVLKVQAEVRKLELENIRYAARLLNAEREDPDIEKKILVSGNGVDTHLDVNS